MMVQNGGRNGPAIFEGLPAVDAVLKQAWYTESVDVVPDGARHLLEQYSKLEPEEVVPHVVKVVICPWADIPSNQPIFNRGSSRKSAHIVE